MIGFYEWKDVNAKAVELVGEFGVKARYVVFRIRAAARARGDDEANRFFYEVDARLAQEFAVTFREEREWVELERRINEQLEIRAKVRG
jgi:hypothetical protein